MSPSMELASFDASKDGPLSGSIDRPTTQEASTVPPDGDRKEEPVGPIADNDAHPSAPERVYITGWRLYVLMFGLLLAFFLSTLETTIVSTSLVSISNALDDFDRRNWIVTSYLLPYTGFLVIYAKFSDVLGRKIPVLTATAIFAIASIACGFASTMDQLIILRAFQGLGASGINALVNIINPELVPTKHWGTVIAAISLTMVLSSSLGPLLGGLITENTTWRWVFLFNAPPGAIASIIIYLMLPANFPNHGPDDTPIPLRERFSRESAKRLDFIGAFLLLASSIMMVFAFEEAGVHYPWDGPIILSMLILSILLFAAFLAYEHFIGRPTHPQEPVFPLRLLKSRMFVGLIMQVLGQPGIGFCAGPPFWTALINLPQRFQAIDGLSPLQAGIHLFPMVLSTPVGTAAAGQLTSRLHIPPFYVMLASSSLLIIGSGLLSSLDALPEILGSEALLGLGLGFVVCVVMIYIPFVIERKDLAVTMGVFNQLRLLGGTIEVAISAAIMNNQLSKGLPSVLPSGGAESLLSSLNAIDDLPESVRNQVRRVFSDAFTLQFQAMLAFCGMILLATGLLWERPLRRARDVAAF